MLCSVKCYYLIEQGACQLIAIPLKIWFILKRAELSGFLLSQIIKLKKACHSIMGLFYLTPVVFWGNNTPARY